MADRTKTVERVRSIQTGKTRDIPSKSLPGFLAQQRTIVEDGKAVDFVAAWQHVETRVTDLDTGEVEVIPADTGEVVGRPAVNASKDDWEAYAASVGIDVDGLTKAQLIDAVEQA